MAKQELQDEPLSPRLEAILAMRAPADDAVLSDLAPADVEQMAAIARGQTTVAYRSGRAMAVNVLARLPEREQGVAALHDVMLATEDDLELRALAAANLGRVATPAAELALLDGLATAPSLVKAKALQALGQFGGPDALEVIDALPEDDADFVARQRRLAQTLIAYRQGLERDPLPYVAAEQRRPTADDRLLELALQPVGAERIAFNRSRFHGSHYGLALSADLGFELNIGQAYWMVFLNDQIAQELVTALVQQRHIVGLLARHAPLGNAFDTQYIVLSRPAVSGTVDLMVVRTDGEIFYSGQGTLAQEALQFVVGDVARPGTAPTYVEGSYGPAGLSFQVTYPFRSRTGKRQAQPLTRPGSGETTQ
jgi:hypothetical protein